MQFSLPLVEYLPDERIDNISYDRENFSSETKIMQEYSNKNTVDIIKNIFTSDLDDKDKLYNVRRRIADTLKENARGEEYV